MTDSSTKVKPESANIRGYHTYIYGLMYYLHANIRTWYLKTLDEKLACISREREGYWSEAIAIGDPDWLEMAASEAGIKRYTVQNDKNAYIDFMTGKN